MSDPRTRGGGSRFLYEPFDRASARIDAHERVTEERWKALERRLAQIEDGLDRLEKRVWIAVFGSAAFLASELAYSIYVNSP